MLFRLTLGVSVVAAILMSTGAARADQVRDIVNQISTASVWDFNSRPNFLYTQPGCSRRHNAPAGYTGANFYDAQNNIRDTFASDYGAANVTVDTAGGWNNVWVTKLGAVNPDKIYVVGSHYDSFSYVATDPAPGGNDNASGVSAVLELARVFKDYQFQNTIVFMAFDGEESGLNGSRLWTQAHSAANIAGMIEMDCISYNPNNSHHNKAIAYTGHSQSLAWRTALAAAMSAYSGGAISGSGAAQPYDCSDYANFEDHGWPACILAEDGVMEDLYRNMHTVNDNVTYGPLQGDVDPNLEGNITKGVAGFLAANLQPLLVGDANADGLVDVNDMAKVIANYNMGDMTWAAGDFDRNGTVDVNDLSKILAAYDESTGGAVTDHSAAPEPSSLLLLVTAIAGIFFCGRYCPTLAVW